MDVDYVVIRFKDRREAIAFVMGVGTIINDDNTPQLTKIDRNGKIHTNGPISVAGDFLSPFWLPSVGRGLKRPTPVSRLPVFGPYDPGARR